ncbi:MAG: A/G-specific adenine glycosylase [Bacteroidaceae bacterium]
MADFDRKIEWWYEQKGRELPWRNIKDAYRIWVSEIILQQTRVAQGFVYYERFIARFPSVEELAGAEEDEVLSLWQGLGYYSRARNLHKAAQSVVEQGGFPVSYSAVRALSGIGDYTAAAICSFAYDMPYAVLDGNVYRVLSRYFAIAEPIDGGAGKRLFANLATQLLDKKNPAHYNQAIMDFGAMQCVPVSPDCVSCPLSDACEAFRRDEVECFPVKTKKVKQTNRYFVYIFIYADGYLYLRKRTGKDIWKGLYEPLLLEFPIMPSVEQVLSSPSVRNFLGFPGTSFRVVKKQVRHVLSHQILSVDSYKLSIPSKDGIQEQLLLPGFIAVEPSELPQYAVPRLIERLLESENL